MRGDAYYIRWVLTERWAAVDGWRTCAVAVTERWAAVACSCCGGDGTMGGGGRLAHLRNELCEKIIKTFVIACIK